MIFLKKLFGMQSETFPDNPSFRFLFTPSRWRIIKYKNDNEKAIDEAIKDLDPKGNDNLSIFSANITNKEAYTDFELIAFLLCASSKTNNSDIGYVDINLVEIKKLGLKIRKNKATANLKIDFYSDRHYEIYPINYDIRRKLAEIIFKTIINKYNGELALIKKNRISELITIVYRDNRINGIRNEKIYDWAKEKISL